MAVADYPLGRLLTVRRLREESARSAVSAAEERCHDARKLLEACQVELARYRAWRLEEAQRRYDAVMGAALGPGDVADFRAGLTGLDVGEQERAAAVQQAQEALNAREQELAAARVAALKARKDTAKIDMHRDIWSAEARAALEHWEELELEEFARPVRHNDEG